MSRLPDVFHQDKALRDAARDVLVADVEHAKATMSGKALAGRVAGRVGEGAKDVLEIAKGHASDRQGILAGIIALIALWFARGTIAEILGLADASDGAAEALDDKEARAENAPEADEYQKAEPTEPPEEPDTFEPEPDGLDPARTGEIA